MSAQLLVQERGRTVILGDYQAAVRAGSAAVAGLAGSARNHVTALVEALAYSPAA
jgi:hypothetical protein